MNVGRTLKEATEDHSRELFLKAYPHGIIGSHSDDGQSPIKQHEWHIDHAPSLADVLKGRMG